jgi:hypothetical protein
MSSDSGQLAVSVSGSSVSLLPETGEQHDVGLTGRQRKAPTIFEGFVDEKSIAQEIKTYSSYSKKAVVKKRLPVDNIANADAKKPRGSQGTLPKKTKLQPLVVIKEPSLSIKEKEQLQIEEEFIKASQEHLSKSQNVIYALPVGPSKPMEMSAAIKKGVKECSKLLLDWSKPAAKLVGSLCKVYWDGENQWFYARILNYDCGFNQHYVSLFNFDIISSTMLDLTQTDCYIEYPNDSVTFVLVFIQSVIKLSHISQCLKSIARDEISVINLHSFSTPVVCHHSYCSFSISFCSITVFLYHYCGCVCVSHFPAISCYSK